MGGLFGGGGGGGRPKDWSEVGAKKENPLGATSSEVMPRTASSEGPFLAAPAAPKTPKTDAEMTRMLARRRTMGSPY